VKINFKIIIVIISTFILFLNIFKNTIIKNIIEQKFKKLTEHQLEIESIDVSILNKTIDINGLKIRNSNEFNHLYLLSIEKIIIDDLNLKNKSIGEVQFFNTNIFWDKSKKNSNVEYFIKKLKSFEKNKEIPESDQDKITEKEFNKEFYFKTIALKNTSIIFQLKKIGNKQFSIPLDDYFSENKYTSTLLDEVKSYSKNTLIKIDNSKRLDNLILIFPKLKSDITKLKKNLKQKITYDDFNIYFE